MRRRIANRRHSAIARPERKRHSDEHRCCAQQPRVTMFAALRLSNSAPIAEKSWLTSQHTWRWCDVRKKQHVMQSSGLLARQTCDCEGIAKHSGTMVHCWSGTRLPSMLPPASVDVLAKPLLVSPTERLSDASWTRAQSGGLPLFTTLEAVSAVRFSSAHPIQCLSIASCSLHAYERTTSPPRAYVHCDAVAHTASHRSCGRRHHNCPRNSKALEYLQPESLKPKAIIIGTAGHDSSLRAHCDHPEADAIDTRSQLKWRRRASSPTQRV